MREDTTPRPFLFVQCRPEGAIAEDERASVARLGGLHVGTTLVPLMLLDEPAWDPSTDLDLDAYAGVIISGSPYSAIARAGEEARVTHMRERAVRLAARLLDEDYPTLGLCYGLHVLAVAMGEPLTDAYSEDLQAVDVTLTDEGLADPVCARLPARLRAFVGHTDAICAPLPGGRLLGQGGFCKHQLIRVGAQVYACQFHPEITTAGMRLRIDAYAGHYYGARERDAVIARCMHEDVESGNALITAFVDAFRAGRD